MNPHNVLCTAKTLKASLNKNICAHGKIRVTFFIIIANTRIEKGGALRGTRHSGVEGGMDVCWGADIS